MSLGPVIRNALEQPKGEIKPHLAQRLFADTVARQTEEGCLCVVEGKMAFVPNYAGENPCPPKALKKDAPYVPFQGEHAYLNPDPKERVLDAVHQLVNPHSWDPLTEPLAVGDKVEFVCKDKRGGVFVGARGVVTGIDFNRYAPSESLVMCAWDKGSAKAAPPNVEGYYRKRLMLLEKAVKEEPKPQAAPKIDPMTEPWKVGDRVQKIEGTVNYLRFGVISKIDDNGTDWPTLHIKWETNPDNDDGRWRVHAGRNRNYFKIVERDGVPVC